jgi:phage antirepressor YoqD-like protein
VDDSTIRRHIRALIPGLAQNGKATLLTEAAVTAIKAAVARSGNRGLGASAQVESVHTSLEMLEKARDVVGWLTAEADRLRGELAIAAPKAESFDALMVSERCMSITDAAKLFGLHPRTAVFPYLRARGYLTQADLPTMAAIEAGYLTLREDKGTDGVIRPRAVVEACQLEAWRLRVVPQIRQWAAARVSA